MSEPSLNQIAGCECKHDWEKIKCQWTPVMKGRIVGRYTFTFVCKKCGKTKEEQSSIK